MRIEGGGHLIVVLDDSIGSNVEPIDEDIAFRIVVFAEVTSVEAILRIFVRVVSSFANRPIIRTRITIRNRSFVRLVNRLLIIANLLMGIRKGPGSRR